MNKIYLSQIYEGSAKLNLQNCVYECVLLNPNHSLGCTWPSSAQSYLVFKFILQFSNAKREMSCEISGGTFDWSRPPDWPKQIRHLRQGSCLLCLGQSRGLVHSIFPPEILHDISFLARRFESQNKIIQVTFNNLGSFNFV